MDKINSPLDIRSSDLLFWYDVSDSTTMRKLSSDTVSNVVNGDLVGLLADKSTNNRHLSASNVHRPTYVSSASALKFSSINNTRLHFTSPVDIPLSQAAIFVVASPHLYSANARILTFAEAGAADTTRYIPFSLTNTLGTVGSNNNANVSFRSLSSFDVLLSRPTGTTFYNYSNGMESAVASLNITANYNLRTLKLGANISNGTTGDGTSNLYDGYVSEIIVYRNSLNTIELIRLLNYLSSKWSVNGYIPRTVYAIQNGNWSDNTTWSVSGLDTPYNLPLSADSIYTNSFTVSANVNAIVNSFTNFSNQYISTNGTVSLSSGVSLSARFVTGTVSSNLPPLTLLPEASATFVGNIIVGNNSNTAACILRNTQYLTVIGSLTGFDGDKGSVNRMYGLSATEGSSVFVKGNIGAGDAGSNYSFENPLNISCLVLNTSGFCTIVGNLIANSSSIRTHYTTCVLNLNSSVLTISGNLFGSNCNTNFTGGKSTLNNFSLNPVFIYGDIIGGNSSFMNRTAYVFQHEGRLAYLFGNIYGNTGSSGTIFPTIDVGSSSGNLSTLFINSNEIVGGNSLAAVIGAGNVQARVASVRSSILFPAINLTTTGRLSVIADSILNSPNGTHALNSPITYYYPVPTGVTEIYVTGNSTNGRTSLPSNVSAFTKLPQYNFSNIVVGANFAIAQSANTTKWFGTGDGTEGVFGQGGTVSYSTFTLLTGDWQQMFAGYSSVFALSANTRQWFVAGRNNFGQLGLGHTTTPVTSFTQITGNWSQFVEGGSHTFAQSANTFRWYSAGLNNSGQLALYDTLNRTTFNLITGNYIKITCGLNHTVALSSTTSLTVNNRVNVWGSNANGQLGLGTTRLSSFSAIVVTGNFYDIGCGDNHTVLVSGGSSVSNFIMHSTGRNTEGQLGLGNNNNQTTFQRISAGLWDAVACGSNFTFARDINTGFWAGVGQNTLGQLGLNSTSNTNVFTVTGTNKNVIIIPGNDFTYALDPIFLPTVTRFARNGYSTFTLMYSEDALIVPPLSSDVVSNYSYFFNTLTGTMILPALSTTTAGVAVGESSIGNSFITVNEFWNTPLSSINEADTMGMYLKKTLTNNALTAVLNSLDFSKI